MIITWLAVKQVGPAIGNAEGRVPIGARQELLGVWGGGPGNRIRVSVPLLTAVVLG